MIYNKLSWLSHLFYEIGKQQDLQLQVHLLHNDIVTKWHHYLYIYEQDWFMNNCNHRTPLKNEIILDFDGVVGNILFNQALKRLNMYDKDFDGWIAYSGTNHIHLYLNKLFYMKKREREDYRLKVIKEFRAEELKHSDRSLIALEYAPHWKRGDIKTRLMFNMEGMENDK